MRRTVPQVISLVAIVTGVALFVVTMLGIDRTETVNEVRRLGVSLPHRAAAQYRLASAPRHGLVHLLSCR